MLTDPAEQILKRPSMKMCIKSSRSITFTDLATELVLTGDRPAEAGCIMPVYKV